MYVHGLLAIVSYRRGILEELKTTHWPVGPQPPTQSSKIINEVPVSVVTLLSRRCEQGDTTRRDDVHTQINSKLHLHYVTFSSDMHSNLQPKLLSESIESTEFFITQWKRSVSKALTSKNLLLCLQQFRLNRILTNLVQGVSWNAYSYPGTQGTPRFNVARSQEHHTGQNPIQCLNTIFI